MIPRCPYCRPDETPKWGVNSIAYSHTPGAISHYCSSGRRVVVGLDELEGEELAWAQHLVGSAAADSKANAAGHR